jgi:hypothetical protein
MEEVMMLWKCRIGNVVNNDDNKDKTRTAIKSSKCKNNDFCFGRAFD